MTLGDLVILFAVGVVALMVWQNAGFKERAIGLARQHCDAMDVQLLDETVSMQTIKPTRDKRGNWWVGRTFAFEFSSTGDERYQGEIEFHGTHLIRVQLQPHRMH